MSKTKGETYNSLQHRLQERYVTLIDKLDPDPVLDYLYQERVLNKSEYESVRREKTVTEKNRELLMILQRKSEGGLNIFVKTLEDTGQDHVASLLDNKARDSSLTVVKNEHEKLRQYAIKMKNYKHVLENWDHIGRRLGLSDADIYEIGYMHQRLSSRVYEMVNLWIQRFGFQADTGTFLDALREEGLELTSQDLAEKE